MEIFSYLWLSVLIAFLLATTVSLPDNYKIGNLEFTRGLFPAVAFFPALYFYWAILEYNLNPVLIVSISTILIYISLDIKAVTAISVRILGRIKELEIREARDELYKLANKSGLPLSNLCTDNMDEDAVITASVEYTARALVPNTIAPLFYAVLLGPLGAIVYKIIGDTDKRIIRDILNYIPARLGFVAFWIATLTVTKNRAYMMEIVKRDMPNSKNKTDELIVAGFAGTTWMRLGGNKEYYDIYDEANNTTFVSEEVSFGDMREPPHLSDILRATKLFNLTVIIFIVLALCIREYEFIWYFLKKFVI